MPFVEDPTLLPPAVKASQIEETEGRKEQSSGENWRHVSKCQQNPMTCHVKQDNMAGGVIAGGSLLSAYLQDHSEGGGGERESEILAS
ncbi:hypothetical protein Dsin_010826 [Dipteronia sinensis]|uniref:Uncharacterized protein n=1 Tax=Dipteronia sinensis TaxID=43782 RepID=A0AAE0AT89_9ROSI|nr:hypothetical protein Dsin_010826 [Dipteronia sinensis]